MKTKVTLIKQHVRARFSLISFCTLLSGLGLCLILYGAAVSQWNETENNSMLKLTKNIPYEGKDVYLNTKTYLFGSENAISMELASGTHRYEFSCRLPSSLPASIKTKFGRISYNLEAFLDIPWNYDREFKLKFTVIRDSNLNNQPELKIPCKAEKSHQFWSFPFQFDPLVMTVSLLFTGFVPGQKIHVNINYSNKSSVVVRQTKILLRKIVRVQR